MKEEWLAWRKTGLGASDSPIIMEVSDYKTPLQLFEEKLGISETPVNEYITGKGNRNEPRARALYELHTGVDAPAVNVAHADFPWLRASLDGLTPDRFIEIKYVGNGEKWELAKAGIVAPCYVPQVQHQAFVTGLPGDYVCFNGEEIIIVPVLPDMDYLNNVWFPKVQSFWFDHVLKKVPPPEVARDYKQIRDKNIQALLERYRELKQNNDIIAKSVDLLKEEIFSKLEHRRAQWDGIKIIPKARAGNIDYKKVLKKYLPELDPTELDQFRGKEIVYREIRI